MSTTTRALLILVALVPLPAQAETTRLSGNMSYRPRLSAPRLQKQIRALRARSAAASCRVAGAAVNACLDRLQADRTLPSQAKGLVLPHLRQLLKEGYSGKQGSWSVTTQGVMELRRRGSDGSSRSVALYPEGYGHKPGLWINESRPVRPGGTSSPSWSNGRSYVDDVSVEPRRGGFTLKVSRYETGPQGDITATFVDRTLGLDPGGMLSR